MSPLFLNSVLGLSAFGLLPISSSLPCTHTRSYSCKYHRYAGKSSICTACLDRSSEFKTHIFNYCCTAPFGCLISISNSVFLKPKSWFSSPPVEETCSTCSLPYVSCWQLVRSFPLLRPKLCSYLTLLFLSHSVYNPSRY